MYSIRKSQALRLILALSLVLSGIPLMAQQTLIQPTVYQSTATVVAWTAGTVNNGGHAVAVSSGTASITTSKTDCSAPAYAGCNFVYANSSGTVAVTTTPSTAFANGNSILAYVEASGSAITNIAYPQQASTATLPRLLLNCGTTTTCAATSAGPGIFEVTGSVALTSASPSQATVIGLPFTSTSSYFCTAIPVGTTAAIAAAGVAVSLVGSSTITLTGPNTVTTVIHYHCTGT